MQEHALAAQEKGFLHVSLFKKGEEKRALVDRAIQSPKRQHKKEKNVSM
jgi:hypothetical protein